MMYGSVVESIRHNHNPPPTKKMSNIAVIETQFQNLASKHPQAARIVLVRNAHLRPVAGASEEVVRQFWLMMVTELRHAL